jgi:hypothetical protein
VHIDERLDKEQNLDQKVDSVMNKLKWVPHVRFAMALLSDRFLVGFNCVLYFN